MRATVFINYVDGIHHNDIEQQRQILTHASRQKGPRKEPGVRKTKSSRERIVPADLTRYIGIRKQCPRFQDDSCRCDLDAHPELEGHAANLWPRCDGAIKGVGFDPFDALPSSDMPGLHMVVEYGMSASHGFETKVVLY